MKARSTTPPLVGMLIVTMLLAMIAGSTQAQPVSPSAAVNKDTSPSTTCTFNDVMPPPYNQSSAQNNPQYWAVGIYQLCTANPTPVMTGYPDGYFRPNNYITRQEYAKLAVLLSQYTRWPIPIPGPGTPTPTPTANCSFSDIHPGDALYNYVNAICQAGIVTGYPPDQCVGPGTPVPAQKCFKPNNTIRHDEMAVIIVGVRRYAIPTNCNNLHYVDISGDFACKYIEALYSNYVTANPGSHFVPTRQSTRGYAAFYAFNTFIPAPDPPSNPPTLGQAFASKQSNIGFTYVEVRKTVPIRNYNLDYDWHGAAGPVGLSDLATPTTTFIESGPSSNPPDYRYGFVSGLHSYTSSSAGNSVVNVTTFLEPNTGYYYYSQYTPSGGTNWWTAAACDPYCGFSTAYNLGVAHLPFIGSNAETMPEAENLGGTITSDALYSVVGSENTYPWCYDPSLIQNVFLGANFTQGCNTSSPIWGIYATHD